MAVTYDLTRLMRLAEDHPRMLVTLGRTDLVDPDSVIAEMTYEHPVYTRESVAAQALLPDLNTARLAFAGAYHGWGFHEDGALSGVRAAAALGVDWGDGSGQLNGPGPLSGPRQLSGSGELSEPAHLSAVEATDNVAGEPV